MAIYTYGFAESYDPHIKTEKEPKKLGPQLDGPHEGYLGGIAFKTATEASLYLSEENLSGYAVYEMDGDWDSDTYIAFDEGFYRINKDLPLVRRVL